MAGGLPKGHAHAQVRRARALRHLPVCAKAWLDGDLGASHLDVLSAVRREATADALERDEELLVGQARLLRRRGLRPRRCLLGPARGSRRRRGPRRGSPCPARRLPGGELPGHVARQDHPRSHLGCDRLRRARAPRKRALRGRLGRRPGPARARARRFSTWPAARASAGPMPSSRWPPAAARPQQRGAGRLLCSVCSSATRHCRGASASWARAPCRGQRHGTALHRSHPAGD